MLVSTIISLWWALAEEDEILAGIAAVDSETIIKSDDDLTDLMTNLLMLERRNDLFIFTCGLSVSEL